MLQKLGNNKFAFYGFFLLIWVFIQLISGNLLCSFNPACKTADAFSYTESAYAILNGGYPWFRAVGYPMLLAPFLSFLSENAVIGLFTLFQTILWLLSIRLIYNTLKNWGAGNHLSLLGSFLFGTSISALLTTNHLLTETGYNFLMLLSLYFLSHWLKDKNYKYAGWIFITLVVSALIRPLGLNFFYASIIILAIGLYRGNFKLIPYFGLALILLGSHLFMMKKHHNTTQICMSKNHALYHYLNMKVSHYPNMNASSYVHEFFDLSAQLDDSIGEQKFFYSYRDSIYSRRNKAIFTTSKYATLKTMYVNFKDEIWTGYSNHRQANLWVYTVTKWQHLLVFISLVFSSFLFVIRIIRNQMSWPLRIWLAISLFICTYISLGSSLVFWYGDRLHLPLYPLVIMITILLIANPKTKQIEQ